MLRQLSNPNQSPTNFIKMTAKAMGCCPSPLGDCRNVFTFASLAMIGFLRFCYICRGKEETVDVDLSGATSISELEDLIYKKASEMIPEGGFGGKIESDGSGQCINVKENADGTIEIAIDSDINFKCSVDTAGEVTPVTQLCDKIRICTGQFMIEKDKPAGSLVNTADDSEAILGTYAAGDAATIVTDVTAGYAAIGVPVDSVTVEEKDGFCLVSVASPAPLDQVTLNGKAGADCGCKVQWAAAEQDEKAAALRKSLLSNTTNGKKGEVKGFKVAAKK